MADIVEQDIVDRAMELVCAGWLDPEEASAALSDCADELTALRARCERYRKALELYRRRDGKFRECRQCTGNNSDCRKNGCASARAALQEQADE